MHTKINLLVAAALMFVGCDDSAPATVTPAEAETAAEAPAEAEAAPEEAEAPVEAPEEAPAAEEPAAEPEPPAKDSITVATFNLRWAHDTLVDGKETKRIASSRAQTDEDWEWKYEALGKAIAAAKPDVIALHEVGGYLEASDIVGAIEAAGGPGYELAFVDSEDSMTGHHSAVLSTLPTSNERRFDIGMRRQMAVDVELPNGGSATLVALHPPEGSFKKPAASRREQVEALLRETRSIQAQQPVIYMATMGSEIAPGGDDYAASAAGMLAGASTGKKDDDCEDSGDAAGTTTVAGKLADRVISCGMSMRGAEAFGRDIIVVGDADEGDWHKTDADKRDTSDHLIVIAELELPKAEAEAEAAE